METISKIVLGAALLPVLLLGLRMATGQAGRGHLTTTHGLTILRSILVPLWVLVTVWYVVAETTMPAPVQFEPSTTLRAFGLATFVRAMLMRIWAQRTLGQYWSADVSLRDDHDIVQRGPYYWFAHPIYFSYWPIAIGLLIATGNVLVGGIGLVYAFVSYLRIPAEQQLLRWHFGDRYTVYLAATRERRWLVVVAIIAVLHVIGGGWELAYLLG